MILNLIGHEYKYAVEQIMLTLFPTERPVYGEEGPEDALRARCSLSHGAKFSTAVTGLRYGGETYTGRAKIATPDPGDRVLYDRQMQKIIKLSFYRAAVAATGVSPPWGALTGVRPGKIASKLLEAGSGPERAGKTMEREYRVSPERAALCIDAARAGLRLKESLGPRDICLYIGIPFCPTRCAYCSFVSHSVEKSMHLVEPFLGALHREIAATAEVIRAMDLRVVSIYMGGGTPTTLTGEQMSGLTAALRAHIDHSHLREYTVEAGRPDTLDADKLRRLRREGVTRISVNPQTMEDHVLRAIGRHHSAADIRAALALARAEGFSSLNMDLIAGLPKDSPEGFARTLDRVLSFGVENVTVHTLALKKGAKLMLEETGTPTPAEVGTMLDAAGAALRGAGYAPYYLYRQKYIAGGFENVGWAKPGHESLYNIAIMEELCSILSLGGGGSTKLVAPQGGRIKRIFNAKYPYEYTQGIDKILDTKRQIREFYEDEVFRHAI